MDYRDNRQRWAESHQVVHFYAGQWSTFTPALTQPPSHTAPARRIFHGESNAIAPECRSADCIVGA